MLRQPRSAQEPATDYPSGAAVDAAVNDYDALNSVGLSGDATSVEVRLAKVIGFLKRKRSRILDSAEKYQIHPSAVAIAIGWEFVENIGGYASDQLPTTWQKGYGFAQFHRETIKKLFPTFSDAEIDRVRGNSELAIPAIAQYIGRLRDTYRTLSHGIDLSSWPEGLAWLYNTREEYIARKAAPAHAADVDSGKPVTLVVADDMAVWGRRHMASFAWLEPKTALPVGKVAFARMVVNPTERQAITTTEWNARAEDERYPKIPFGR